MSGRFSRRALLAQVGGAAALLPLLNARRGLGAPTFPRRLVILQPTNGVLQEQWWPTQNHDTDFTLGPTLAPLIPYKQDIVLLRGLAFTVMKENKPEYVGAFGGHEALPFMLTGAPGAMGVYDGSIKVAVADAPSLDWYISGELARRGSTPIRTLNVGAAYVDGKDNLRSLSFRGPALGGLYKRPQDNPPEISPQKVFDRLFGDMAAGVATADLERFRRRRKGLLDFMGGELEALSKRLGSDDRAKIQAHLQGVLELDREVTALGNAAACAKTDVVPAGLNPKDPFGLDRVLPLQLKLVAAAFRCNLTQVATVQMVGPHNNSIGFPFLGAEFTAKRMGDNAGDGSPYWTHHMMAHNQTASPANRAQKNAVDTWFVQLFADFLGHLKSIPEGDGTMLDNTVVLFANNMGDGGGHWIDRLPWIVAGGGAAGIKTGRYLRYPETPHNQLLTTLANVMLEGTGSPALGYFGDPRYPGELAGLR